MSPSPASDAGAGEDAAPEASVTWPEVFTTLVAHEDLDARRAAWVMDRIMAGEASSAQVAGFLMALRTKGETVEEMRGIADRMLAYAYRIEVPGPSLDIVGTGGDRRHTVNISTMSAVVCAAAGVTVVKHGNRAASSSSGAADVLEALGIDLTLPVARVAELASQVGITFCFAQVFHPSFRHAAEARSALGVGTAFNFLGPLTNPAQPTFASVGVADRRMAPILAGVFAGRGKDAAVFRGDDGLDELTLETTSSLWWVRGGQVREVSVDPTRLGLAPSPTDALRGGDARHNAQVVRDLVAGAQGPVRDAVVLNAGVALALTRDDRGGSDDDLHADLRAGMDLAEQVIDSGAAAGLVARWVEASQGRPR